MTGWRENGPYSCDWTTNNVPKIKSDHLKGSKLSVYGTLDWNDQGWGNRKGTFRLRLKRDGKEVEGSEQRYGAAEHARTKIDVDFTKTCELWQEGDEIVADLHVGGGGGHRLTVHDATLYVEVE